MSKVRAHYAKGKTGKVIAARLLLGSDLITGMEQLCKENNIQFAMINSCFGSFEKSGYLYLVPKKESKIGVGYGDLIVKEGPIEFLNGTGIICQRDGEFDIHLHGSMCDQEGNIFGGHLVKGENPVITVDLVITEVQGMEFHRQFDEETGANQFYPVEHGQSSTSVLSK